MANSRYEYVRKFEDKQCLPRNTWIVVRVDGRGFHRFTKEHDYTKPNDSRGLSLMNQVVLRDFGDVVMAYGQSDEYSFVLRPDATVYSRRSDKISTTVAALFASSFVFHWSEHFPDKPLRYPPTFDARCVCYPSELNIKDYMRWRQVDCHINNLFNTTFWALVQMGGLTCADAEKALSGTVSADKHDILFNRFGINYNNEPLMYRRGSLYIRTYPTSHEPAVASTNAAACAAARKAARRSSGPDGDAAHTSRSSKPAGGDTHVATEPGAGSGAGGAGAGGGAPSESGGRADAVASGTQVAEAKQSARDDAASRAKPRGVKRKWKRKDMVVRLVHDSVVGESFWKAHPELLERGRL